MSVKEGDKKTERTARPDVPENIEKMCTATELPGTCPISDWSTFLSQFSGPVSLTLGLLDRSSPRSWIGL